MYYNVQSIAYVCECVWYLCIFYCLSSVLPITAEQKSQHSSGSSEDNKYFWLGVIIPDRAKIWVQSESWGRWEQGGKEPLLLKWRYSCSLETLPHHLPEGLREGCSGKGMTLTDQQRRSLVGIVSVCTHTSAQVWELGSVSITQSGVVLREAPRRRSGHIGMREPGGWTVPSMTSTE